MIPSSHEYEMQQCLRITNELLSHPAGAPFSFPIDPINDGAPDYYLKIKSPQDLGTIQKRLENNEYKSFAQWKNDVSLVWSNAISYNGQDTAIGDLAMYMNDLFNKYVDEKMPENEESWISSLIHFSLKLKTLKNSTGKKLSSVFPVNKSNRADEIRKLSVALNNLKEKEDIVQITRIILLFEQKPKLDLTHTKEETNLNDLSDDTIYCLILYARRRYFELKMEYPK